VLARGRQVRDRYEVLRRAIVSGALAPGSRLLETEIAARLGISRSSVRTVLHRLLQEGYLVAVRGGRARLAVAPLTRRDFAELNELLSEVNGLAAARVARLPDGERRSLVKELRKANALIRSAARAEPRDRAGIFALDVAFHDRIVAGADS